jgi:hypothetical protein
MKTLENYRNRFFEDWYQFSNWAFFLLLCLLYFAIFFLKKAFVLDNIAAFEILAERGEMWVFDLIFGLQYLSVPFFLVWKFTLTAFILWVGCFMFGYLITFNQLWRWVMFSELIFIVPELIKPLWFMITVDDPIYQDVVAFYPLSLINLVDYNAIAPRWHYPLKSLNIFEPMYWFALTVGVFYLSKKKWRISVYIVLSSYVLFFLLWLVYYTLVYK